MRAGAAGDPDQQGFLIVETNFRVFAIEPTDLQVALLSKFVEVQYRFPNMAVGTLTRTSVRGALMNGTQRATLRPLVP
jgi:transcription initiation factor TFIIH subunit 4